MTQPNPDQGQQGQESSSSSNRKAPKVKVTDVVSYVHRDHILGLEHDELGVVTEVGDVLQVRPLAGHYVQVDPADVTVVSADDVS